MFVSGGIPSTSRLEGILSVLFNARVEAIMELKAMDVQKNGVSEKVTSEFLICIHLSESLESIERRI
jgi:hypothetical protein